MFEVQKFLLSLQSHIEEKSAQPVDTQYFREKQEIKLKVIVRCYNQRKQNLEGSKRAA